MPLRLPSLLAAVFGLLAVASLHLGLRTYPPATVWAALTQGGTDAEALIVTTLRLPRLLLATVVGAMLALSGLLMQAATRNPIAEPALIGVNGGAAFAVVAWIVFLGDPGMPALMAIAAFGALAAGALVFGFVAAAAPGFPAAGLLLAGVAVSALLASGVQVVVLMNEGVMEELIFWLSGAFEGRPLAGLPLAAALGLAAALAGLALAPALDVMAADDATAAALGVATGGVRAACLVAGAALAGAGVALAGPVAFVGLAAPHLARLSGLRGHRALIPVAVLWGAILGVGADIAARFVLYPSEAPVSAVTALIGVPILLVLLRRGARMPT
ncbi:FecCD family ABC transporter permease [Aestuariibius sp. 2305UL40-4]|uniref:FecCD family ABC transporter permease n=1 Tax=Aestuariibius violaceus TaxID=3234132 RepID=UPI00345EAEE9